MIVWCLLAYFLGSIPFGLFIGKIAKGIDVREHGSKNIGATNVFRVVGKKWGLFALFLDAFKGYAACSLPLWIAGESLPLTSKLILAICAIAGHTFPVWLKFKGGKGVATSLGVFLAVAWQPTLTAFGFWILIFALFRIISVASLSAGLVYPFCIYFFMRGESGFEWLIGIGLLLAGFMFWTHRANIGRLQRGEEKKLF